MTARSLTSDAGKGLCASHQAVFSDIPWQLDTFHGIAHRLGDYIRRLEKSAYAAIEATDKREARKKGSEPHGTYLRTNT